MPFTLLQVGSNLKSVNTDGGLSAALTLPAGVTLATNRQPRFAKFNRYIAVVNTPTRPLLVGPDGTVYPMTPTAPAAAVALSAGAAGTLSGTYLAQHTYEILDSLGNVITSSDYGPDMTTAVTIASKKLHADFAISAESQVNNNHIFRTVTSGATYFSWANTGNNVTTSLENDLSDASLGTVAAPSLGEAPDLTLIAEFGGRLWGVDRTNIDTLRWTEAGTAYAWAALNSLKIPHVGQDDAGVTALIPRRDAIGVARRGIFNQVTGSQLTNIRPVTVNGGEGVGVVSQESVVVWNDIAYFLFFDGVYKWDSTGISCVTDGLVRSWFTSDKYFNRAMFWRAFGGLDPTGKKYRLLLASVGSEKNDRWIEMDLATGAWYGPHVTDAFEPSCFVNIAGRNQQTYLMMGSRDGYLSQDQIPRNDWGLCPIDLSVTVRSEEMGEPEQEKYFGELAIHVEPQDSGTLTITPELGSVDETTATAPMTADLTVARQRVGRIGTGNSMVLNFDNAEVDVDTAIYGYEVNPVNPIGQR
jgi:hypothetical protein